MNDDTLDNENPRPIDQAAADIYNNVTNIIDGSAHIVNKIRKQVQKSIAFADELEDLADEYRQIANQQQEIAYRIAQLAAESLTSEAFPDDEDDEEDAEYADIDGEEEDCD